MRPRHLLLAFLLPAAACVFLAPVVDWYDRGHSAYFHNELPEASADFGRVIPTDARYQRAQFYLGAILARQGRLDNALAQLQRSRDLSHEKFDQDSELVRGLAEVYGAKVKRWEVKEDDVITQIRPADDALITVGLRGTLSAIDARSQSVLWEKPIGVRGNRGEARPQVDGTQVYVTGTEAGTHVEKLWALDRATGNVRWSADLGVPYEFSNAAIDRDYVFAGAATTRHSGTTLNAYRKTDGRLAFSVPVDGLPNGVTVGKDLVCTQTTTNRIYCARPSKQLASPWTYSATGSIEQGQLAVSGGFVYATIKTDLYGLRIGGDAPLAFKVTGGAFPLSSPTVSGGSVFVQGVEGLRAYDAATGKGLWVATNPGGLKTLGEQLRGRAPQIVGDLVVGWSDELLFGIPKAGGEPAWMIGSKAAFKSNPAACASGVVIAEPQSMVAVAPEPWVAPPAAAPAEAQSSR